MTLAKEIIPDQISLSSVNERQSWSSSQEDDDEWEEFVTNVERNGISQAPVVRPSEDGGYEAIIGQRRVEAAKQANLDQIEVLVVDWDDGEALTKSISENVATFRKDVSDHDRALSLMKLGELNYDGDERPPYSWFAAELGVNKSTISRWLERLGQDWEDTVLDPTSESSDAFDAERLRDLGGRKLTSIRRATGGGEDGEWLAKKTVDEDLTMQDLAQIREYVNSGVSLEDAVGVVGGSLAEGEIEQSSEIGEEEEEVSESVSEPNTTDTTDSPTSPSTSTSTTEQETSTEEMAGSWGDPEEGETNEPEDDEEEETESKPAKEPLVSEEDQELASETDGWADSLETVDTEDGQGESIEFKVELTGELAEAMEEAITHGFDDAEDLTLAAIEKYLREGEWL